MNKYNLDLFLNFLFDWVDSFKFNNIPGQFHVNKNKNKPSLYGICYVVYNLVIPNQLARYLETHKNENIQDWIKQIQLFQNPNTGWIKEPGFNFGFQFEEYSTTFACSALKLLNSRPKYGLKVSKKVDSKEKLERWLKRVPEWGLLFWPGSHRGGDIGSIYATLEREYYPHKDFFEWYFEWLDNKVDPEVGFWRLGWNYLFKKRITKQELGGSIHYYWIYEFLDHPIPYPEKVIDSTLNLHYYLGLWNEKISYCIDLDAIFCLTRCYKQSKVIGRKTLKKR
jgi:hypothetical protein